MFDNDVRQESVTRNRAEQGSFPDQQDPAARFWGAPSAEGSSSPRGALRLTVERSASVNDLPPQIEARSASAAILPPKVEVLLARAESASGALAAAAEESDWTAAGAHDAALSKAAAELGAALAGAAPGVIRIAAVRLRSVQSTHGAALESLRLAHTQVRAELNELAAGQRAVASYRATEAE